MPKDLNKKNIIQDVIPPKRSIRDVSFSPKIRRLEEKAEDAKEVLDTAPLNKEIPIKKNPLPQNPMKIEWSKPDESLPKTPESEKEFEEKVPLYKFQYNEPKKSSKKAFYIIVGILALSLIFGILSFFRRAEVRISPKEEMKSFNEKLTAKKEATGDDLGFQLLTINKNAKKTVEAVAGQNVEKKAQGRIVIYNTTLKSQKLIATTRFETTEGLVFRLLSDVTVPAQNGTNPGSLEVTVEADKPGSSYNIGLKDFTIPGFKSDVKFTKIYARSKTAMTLGFSGMQKTVSRDILDKTDKELENSLKNLLSKNIASQIPSNFIFYPDSIYYNFNPIAESSSAQTNSTDNNLVLEKTATANVLIFDRNLLFKVILAKIAPDISSDSVKIINLDKFNFSYATGTLPLTLNLNRITFSLKGDADIVSVFDQNRLKTDILGLSKKNAEAVIASYPGIKEAWITISPFWNQTIPADSKKVNLINTLTQ